MKIGVIGSGYVGLVCGICFANMGHQVICSDHSPEKIATLLSGRLPIWEQGLEELFLGAQKKGNITFTTDIKKAIEQSDLIIVAVGTPSLSDGSADLSQLWNVIHQIANFSQGEKLLVIKSTVPVGTCDNVAAYLHDHCYFGKMIDVVHNPEFLRQGSAAHDFLYPDRIVIGCESEDARRMMNFLYQEWNAPIQFCDRRSAELIKYTANSFLAMKISYINMIAQLSEKLGADIEEVARGIGSDRRIGSSFLQAGIGYGGSCFPKDIRALLRMGQEAECSLPLVKATEQINEKLPFDLLAKLKSMLGDLAGKKIALIGLAYKPMTDDIREAPSLKISQLCTEENAQIHAYDPLIRKQYPVQNVRLFPNIKECVNGCDAAVILTDWEEFKQLSLTELTSFMRNPLVIDGRNLFPLEQVKQWAEKTMFSYVSMGRPPVISPIHQQQILD